MFRQNVGNSFLTQTFKLPGHVLILFTVRGRQPDHMHTRVRHC